MDERKANRRSTAPGYFRSRLLQSLPKSKKVGLSLAGWVVSDLRLVVLGLDEEKRRSGSLSVQDRGSLPWEPYCWLAAALEEGLFPDPNRPRHNFSMQDRGL